MHYKDQTIRLPPQLLLAFVLALGCGPRSAAEAPSVDPEAARPQGTLELPATVWDQSPRTALRDDEAHGYLLPGKAKARIKAHMRAAQCGLLSPVLHLFAPDSNGGRELLAEAGPGEGAEGDCPTDAVLEATLPDDGDAEGQEYLLVASAANGESLPLHYRLDVTCEGSPCDVSRTLEQTRISDGDLEKGGPDAPEGDQAALRDRLDKAGLYLFQHVFQLREGLGNGMNGEAAGSLDRPNMRLVHNGPFGGPDSQSCVSCHSQGGVYGGGDVEQNIYQAGDGNDPESALRRNPPSLFGVGYKQAIAAEITKQLQAKRAALAAQADASKAVAEGELCIDGLGDPKALCFGELAVKPKVNGMTENEVDTSAVKGVDGDLVVRPFGWKGREDGLYGFVRGGYRVHFGMQAAKPIHDFCSTFECKGSEECQAKIGRFSATWGPPFSDDCYDPDQDGVPQEIVAGQLAATAVHLALLPPPVQNERCGAALRGEAAFAEAGCSTCHLKSLPFTAKSYLDADSKAVVRLGYMLSQVELWSDFKRHDIDGLPERHAFDNYPHDPIEIGTFLTPPLWDVAETAPYMHDGSAATLEEAILAHGSIDGTDTVAPYAKLSAAKKADLMELLLSLGAKKARPGSLCPGD